MGDQEIASSETTVFIGEAKKGIEITETKPIKKANQVSGRR